MDKVYTKTGDKGNTSNFLGKQFSKGDMEIELQGGIDEINSNVGYLRSKIEGKSYDKKEKKVVDDLLREIQYNLYQIGIEIATEFSEVYVKEEEISMLENEIDRMVAATGEMTSFIYYSGGETATYSHVIRSTVRRVERIFVRFLQGKEYPMCYQYVNRLSDYFFTLARYLNKLEGIKDEAMILR